MARFGQIPTDYEFRRQFSGAVSQRANEIWDTNRDFAGALNIASTQSIVRLPVFDEEGIAEIVHDIYPPRTAKRLIPELHSIYKNLKAANPVPPST